MSIVTLTKSIRFQKPQQNDDCQFGMICLLKSFMFCLNPAATVEVIETQQDTVRVLEVLVHIEESLVKSDLPIDNKEIKHVD